jgi:hypothetical protein
MNFQFPLVTQPDGEVVVTKIDLTPDQSPPADRISKSYWVFHNFGNNIVFDELLNIRFERIGFVPFSSTVEQYQLFSRPPRADGDTWQLLDTADELTPGPDGSVLFSDGNGVEEAAQFIISRPMTSAVQQPVKPAPMVSVSPNPVASNGVLNINTNLVGKVKFKLYDTKGRAVRVVVFERDGVLAINGLAAGVYAYSIESERVMRFGKVVVE